MTAIDADAQRERYAAIVLDIVAERGFEAASVRAIAEAAGVAIGTVQYYFPSKEKLLLYTFLHIGRNLERAIDDIAERATGRRAAARAILLELLPLDPRRLAATKVGIAFATRAMHTPALNEQLIKDMVHLRAALAEVFAGVDDPARESATACALADGLGTQLLFGGDEFTEDDAVRAVDAYLDRVFGSEITTWGTQWGTPDGLTSSTG